MWHTEPQKTNKNNNQTYYYFCESLDKQNVI